MYFTLCCGVRGCRSCTEVATDGTHAFFLFPGGEEGIFPVVVTQDNCNVTKTGIMRNILHLPSVSTDFGLMHILYFEAIFDF